MTALAKNIFVCGGNQHRHILRISNGTEMIILFDHKRFEKYFSITRGNIVHTIYARFMAVFRYFTFSVLVQQ
jgi:hypothetical protein